MSIKTRLLLWLMLLPLGLLAITSALNLTHEANERRSSLQQRLMDSTSLTAKAMSEALEDQQDDALRALGEALLEIEEIRSVRLFTAAGTPLLSLGQPPRSSARPPNRADA